MFRDYVRHCQEPDEDTLFHFLNSLHSFNDKLGSYKKRGLLDSANFVGLKALRNLFHHEVELLSKVTIVTEFVQPIAVELLRVCLVDRLLVERAAVAEAAQAAKYKREPANVAGAFKWYGEITDIEPAIFNVVVDAYEAIKELDISPSSEAFEMFEAGYENEEEKGLDHRVTGDISCRVADIDQLLSGMHARAARNV